MIAPAYVVVRLQYQLEDDDLLRTKTIIDLPKERKDLKALITEGGLKEFSFLTSRIRTLCPFIRFKNVVPLGTKNLKKRRNSPNDSEDDEYEHNSSYHGNRARLFPIFVLIYFTSFP